MYIPKLYKVTDLDEIYPFIQAHSFATLITTKNGRPVATHVPLQLAQKDGRHFLTGHLAYSNPQWRTLEEMEEVLVTFQGPNAYISSSWYEKPNIPTWNYQAVHVYGKARLVSQAELKQDLIQLLKTYEQHRDEPVLWDTLPRDMAEQDIKGIVGFELEITEVQAAFKLSQNRSDTDHQNITEELRKEGQPGVADAMAKQRAQEKNKSAR